MASNKMIVLKASTALVSGASVMVLAGGLGTSAQAQDTDTICIATAGPDGVIDTGSTVQGQTAGRAGVAFGFWGDASLRLCPHLAQARGHGLVGSVAPP